MVEAEEERCSGFQKKIIDFWLKQKSVKNQELQPGSKIDIKIFDYTILFNVIDKVHVYLNKRQSFY